MPKKSVTLLVLLIAATMVGQPPAAGQVRHEVQLTSPGYMRDVGSSGNVQTFRIYSYGLGSLENPSVSPADNLLRSSIESPAIYSVTRSGGLGVTPMGGASLLAPPATGGRVYSPLASAIPDLSGAGGVPLLAGEGVTATPLQKATSSYLTSVGAYQTPTATVEQPAPITSMASASNDRFSSYMTEGEKAFKAGDFNTALERFQMANTIDAKNTESLLSLAHASFAMSRNSYFRTAYYITRAIKYLPELPMVPLQPKAFFGNEEIYADRLARLEQYLEATSGDQAAYLVLAYFRWFDKDVRGAADALAKAQREKSDAEIAEAAKAFWDGMKASGKVSGTLESPVFADQAAPPASQPAAQRPDQPTGPGEQPVP